MFAGVSGQGLPPAALQSQGVPPMQVSSQGMMAPPVLPPANLAGQDTSAGLTAGTGTPAQAQAMPLKFDISQILSVIRNNMSAAAQNVK